MIKKEVPQSSTFIVRVENRQNGTWQGKITWADENRTEHFRSMLEMLKLMEEAMASGARAVSDDLEQKCI
jgi:hypothetical protein